ncbi:hypothetical protein ABU162_09155 [Paenibacillus thiaminolyticus]|uniref:prenylated flavin chaperone LpdD n=1 Tax=Paenibacillus thiaminolyticus TaxID=49283 RepID=UPI0035A66F33
MRTFKTAVGEGKHIVEIIAIVCGIDISVVICGGELYHIGACALGIPRASLENKERVSASASVICATGHKEDQLARHASLELAAEFNCRVNAAVGIHINQAEPADLIKLQENFYTALAQIKLMLTQ